MDDGLDRRWNDMEVEKHKLRKIYSVALTKEAFEMIPDESCLKHSSYSSSLNFLIP